MSSLSLVMCSVAGSLFPVCRDPPPVNPSAQLSIDASAPNEVTQEQPAGKNPILSGPPSPRCTVPLSPLLTTPIASQKPNYSSDPVSPEGHSGNSGVDENQDSSPRTVSEEISQDMQSDTYYDGSSSETLQNNPGGSGMLLVSIPPTRVLHGWRFGSEYRWRIPRRWSKSRSLSCVYSFDCILNVSEISDRHGSTGQFIPERSGTV